MPSISTLFRFLLRPTLLLLTLTSLGSLLPAQTLPPGFVDKAYVSGLDRAIGITFDANGTMYTWTKGGEVWIVNNGVKSATPLLDLSDEVGNWRDFGMLCFALDPNFLSNGYFYVLYTVDIYYELNYGQPGYNVDSLDEKKYCTIGRLTRYQAESSTNFTTTDMSSRFVLVGDNLNNGFPSTHQSHHVGYISFGQDGTLMAACGDGASYSTVDEGGPIGGGWVPQALSLGIISAQENIGAYRSQADFSLNGKLIRIDPLTGNGLPSNPNYDALNPQSVQSRTWASGLRNPCRMSLRPGTGSHNASDGDPGVFYIGDVGWGSREELNVSDAPGQNFGWPKYEGITHTPGYNNATWAPTPANHESPRVDWRSGSARAWIKNPDGTRDTVTINPTSSVPGPVFGGNCAIGGVWYTGSDFPEAYRNTYMMADYGGRWIRSFQMDANDNLVEVRDMITGISGSQGRITCVASSPTEGKLYYVFNGSDVRVIEYSPNNLPPVAEAHADVTYGPGALTVNFRGDRSYDPENATLSYLWDFGDGNTSTSPNPSHNFPAGVPTGYEVILTVEDNQTEIDRDTIMVSANNTPPQIVSTSIDNIDYYTGTQNLPLSAVVNDAEQGPGGLTYAWKTVLFHSNHNHPEADDTSPVTNTVITPLDCNEDVLYFWRIYLTVTDDAGLSDVYFKDIYPDCDGTGSDSDPVALFQTDNDEREPFRYFFDASGSYDLDGPILSYSWDFGDGETASGIKPFHVFAYEGSFNVTLTVQDSAGNTDDATAAIDITCSSGPIGAGSLTWEAWLNVGGTGLGAIDFNSTPDSIWAYTIAEGPTNVLDNYGSRLRGYIHAPSSGNYTFWVASDDNSKLFLSTDDTPGNAVEIASVGSWTSSRQWDKFTSQQSAPIALVGGQRYYIEAQMKEGGGGDNLAIGWQLPTGKLERPIPGDYLSPYGSGGRANIWFEDFLLDNGTANDPGATRWETNTTNTSGTFTFNVDGNRFKSTDTDGEAVWLSEVLDISGSGTIDISTAIQSEGVMETADYIRVYYSLDEGPEVLIADRTGNFNGDNPEVVGVTGLSGTTLQVIIRARESATNESHYVDFVAVEGDGLGNIIDVSNSDCRTCGATPASEIALRGDYGSCFSIFVDSLLEIQNEFGEAIMAIDDNNQDLGLITVQTFDHGQDAFAQGNAFYSPRSFKIDVENPIGSNVQVRLYITEAEYQALVAKDAAITGLNKLKIVRYSGGVLGEPGTGSPNIKTPTVSANTGPGGSHELIFNNAAFSTFYVTGPNIAFPVEGLELTVEQDGTDAQVNWVTASEQNSAYFDIERSLDGESFEAIGRESAAGNSSSLLEYSFVDPNVMSLRKSPLYYRLRQVDLDGSFALTDQVILVMDFAAGLALQVFPNPAHDQVTVQFAADAATRATVSVYDLRGRVMFDRQVAVDQGTTQIKIPTTDWSAGMYLVRVNNAGSTQQIKLEIR